MPLVVVSEGRNLRAAIYNGENREGRMKMVLNNIQRISKTFDISFEGFEEQAMDLFREIGRRRKEKVNGRNPKSAKKR